MYEFHGWATIKAMYENVELENENEIEDRVATEIQNHIIKLNWAHGILDIRAINGQYHLWTSGNHNHKPVDRHDPIDFFKYIAAKASGSYGILYIRDSDNIINECSNMFKVYVLAKGTVSEHTDPFLSPFIPTVESFPF
jgi:hypothetical protein